MKRISFEQKLSLLLDFGTLEGGLNGGIYYYSPKPECYDLFGYSVEEKENPAPFSDNSLNKLIDRCFRILVDNDTEPY